MRRAIQILACVVVCAVPSLFAQTPPSSGAVKQMTAPKKTNARPSATTAAKPTSEPFDAATPSEMAARCVTLKTEAGDIGIELLPEAAPFAVRNFLNLAATGAFDSTTFQRVVKGFVIQGGDLSTRANLTAGLAARANRRLPDEPNYVKHERGVVSMARGEEANTATTSFFVLVGDAAHLDNKFAAFGRVTNGMNVVDAINQADTDGETPRKPVRVTSTSVTSCAPATTTPTTPTTPTPTTPSKGK